MTTDCALVRSVLVPVDEINSFSVVGEIEEDACSSRVEVNISAVVVSPTVVRRPDVDCISFDVVDESVMISGIELDVTELASVVLSSDVLAS